MIAMKGGRCVERVVKKADTADMFNAIGRGDDWLYHFRREDNRFPVREFCTLFHESCFRCIKRFDRICPLDSSACHGDSHFMCTAKCLV